MRNVEKYQERRMNASRKEAWPFPVAIGLDTAKEILQLSIIIPLHKLMPPRCCSALFLMPVFATACESAGFSNTCIRCIQMCIQGGRGLLGMNSSRLPMAPFGTQLSQSFQVREKGKAVGQGEMR